MVIFHSYVKIYQRVGYPIEIITTYIAKKYIAFHTLSYLAGALDIVFQTLKPGSF